MNRKRPKDGAPPQHKTEQHKFFSGLNVHREEDLRYCFVNGRGRALKPRAKLKSSYESVGT